MSGSWNGTDMPDPATLSALKRLRGTWFGSPGKSVISVLLLCALVFAGPGILKWSLVNATFTGDATLCHQNGGACWVFIVAKWNLILFGPYPPELLWRPVGFVAMVITLSIWSLCQVRHQWTALLLWLSITVLGFTLMSGGVFGMAPVDRERWGGLPITILITIVGLVGAFPLGVLLALGCRSNRRIISASCRLYVDIVRSIPAITIVFMTFAVVPMLLPAEIVFDKLSRAGTGLALFTAAYFAEALRGALGALPAGQHQAAASLGLGYWRSHAFVILPQVIANSLQPIANIAISFVQNSSLLTIIGLFDLLGAARSSLFDANWQGFYKELYLFVGVIYLIICMYLQHYVAAIERERKARLHQ